MTGVLRALKRESGIVWALGAALAVVAWGAATVLITLATLVAYAVLRLPVLLALHDSSAGVAALLVLAVSATMLARIFLRPS